MQMKNNFVYFSEDLQMSLTCVGVSSSFFPSFSFAVETFLSPPAMCKSLIEACSVSVRNDVVYFVRL